MPTSGKLRLPFSAQRCVIRCSGKGSCSSPRRYPQAGDDALLVPKIHLHGPYRLSRRLRIPWLLPGAADQDSTYEADARPRGNFGRSSGPVSVLREDGFALSLSLLIVDHLSFVETRSLGRCFLRAWLVPRQRGAWDLLTHSWELWLAEFMAIFAPSLGTDEQTGW